MIKTTTFFLLSIPLFVSCNSPKTRHNHLSPTDTISNTNDTVSAHYLHESRFGHLISSSEDFWDSLNGTVNLHKPLKKYSLNPTYKTFGWHLYSNGSTYKDYNFSLLWGIAYFAYIIHPEDGSYENIHQWKTTAMIDSAKVHSCNVFLSIANLGKENNETFLNSSAAQNNLIDSVLSLLALRNGNGINIDFESVPAQSKEKFTAFIQTISKRLKKENPEYQVSICLYAIDYNHIFDIKAIDPAIDFYTLMGYDYYGGFSSIAGPVTPMRGSQDFGEYCLEYSINSYLNKGIAPSKLIVGLPYYGAEWLVNDTTVVAKSKRFYDHLPYKTIKKVYMDSLRVPMLFNTPSLSSYCNHSADKIHKQLWFEGVSSLSIKYDWIKSKKLGGIGIWALGYDNGNEELWNLLSEKFEQK